MTVAEWGRVLRGLEKCHMTGAGPGFVLGGPSQCLCALRQAGTDEFKL